MSKSRAYVCLLLATIVFSSLSFAVTPDRITGALTSGPSVTLHGNVHHKALPQYDQGPADPALRFGSMKLLTTPTAKQVKALKELLAQQQNPKSPNYHKWLTPEQWADHFGLSRADVARISVWLESQGFKIGSVSRARNWISFSGTAEQVHNTFGTTIHRYNVNGEMHVANATSPRIPTALAGIVTGIRGLDDFYLRPRNRGVRARYYDASFPAQFVAPGDIAAIYDINALYNASTPIDGTGQKLAVIGQTDIYLSDLTDFRSGFGLSAITCSTSSSGVISACADPHFKYVYVNDQTGIADPLVPTAGDLSEADLDLEWSGAVARNAQLVYVNAPTASVGGVIQGGVWDAWFYAVDNNLAPVISLSYGLCEFYDNYITDPNSGAAGPDEVELMFANSEGITFVNSSGDSGAAECDYNGTLTSSGLATQGIALGYPASSPEVTGVGGSATPLADFTSTYWGTTNGPDGGTALGYVPEQVWNDDAEIGQYCQQHPSSSFCTSNRITNAQTAQAAIGISSAGGGASNCAKQNASFSACVSGFPQPDWQTVTVSGQPSVRFSPDVSLLASPNFPGYILCTQLSEFGIAGSGGTCDSGIFNAVDNYVSIIGGTSASAPVFAGIVTLVNQATGTSQGNINPMLYQLAATAPAAFNDITSGDIKVYCQAGTPSFQPTTLRCPSTGVFGFSAGTGFDLATGLGSVDMANLAAAFVSPPDFSASADKSSMNVFGGQNDTTTITVAATNSFGGSVSFSCSGLPTGSTCSFNPATVTPPATQSVATITGGAATTSPAAVTITAKTGSLSQVIHPAGSIQLTVTQPFTLAPTAASYAVAQGSSTDATVTLTVESGFTGTITFTCSDAAPLSTCTPPPSTTVGGQVSFHITTTPPSASNRASNQVGRLFYAAMIPGFFGIVLTLCPFKRSRATRLLGLILVMGFSTLWLGACGGSNSGGGGNPGTPKGTYSIRVTGTSGASTDTQTFQLVVQ